ncbi:MAG: hypothetical protein KDB11_27005 [Planctomycetales bacterium]|nr:hypothetical protein [Planctomycetales bacterium]
MTISSFAVACLLNQQFAAQEPIGEADVVRRLKKLAQRGLRREARRVAFEVDKRLRNRVHKIVSLLASTTVRPPPSR